MHGFVVIIVQISGWQIFFGSNHKHELFELIKILLISDICNIA